MAIFSNSWTGRDSSVPVAELVRPPIKSAKLEPKPAEPKRDQYLSEYAELASVIGIAPPDLAIEAFKAFLVEKDIPVFSLTEVVKYMDDKAAKESKDQAGWEWRPLRAKDQMLNAHFGVEAERGRDQYGSRSQGVVRPASDYYFGPHEFERPEHIHQGNGFVETGKTIKGISGPSQSPYDKTIPLHAVRKIAAIEREFTTAPVSFFVCDYALAPRIEHPDPFLMAAVNNPKLRIGIGRFIIDFWDEPGFGIDRMLKA